MRPFLVQFINQALKEKTMLIKNQIHVVKAYTPEDLGHLFKKPGNTIVVQVPEYMPDVKAFGKNLVNNSVYHVFFLGDIINVSFCGEQCSVVLHDTCLNHSELGDCDAVCTNLKELPDFNVCGINIYGFLREVENLSGLGLIPFFRKEYESGLFTGTTINLTHQMEKEGLTLKNWSEAYGDGLLKFLQEPGNAVVMSFDEEDIYYKANGTWLPRKGFMLTLPDGNILQVCTEGNEWFVTRYTKDLKRTNFFDRTGLDPDPTYDGSCYQLRRLPYFEVFGLNIYDLCMEAGNRAGVRLVPDFD